MLILERTWGRGALAIDWDRIGQPCFDRYVEALLHRMFDDSGRVVVVNGRGGNGGIDVQVTGHAGLWIFQLKYHPDGFPGSLKGRRTAIKKSFGRAPIWTAISPRTPIWRPASPATRSGRPPRTTVHQ